MVSLLLIFEIQFGQYYELESTHNKDNVMKVIVFETLKGLLHLC